MAAADADSTHAAVSTERRPVMMTRSKRVDSESQLGQTVSSKWLRQSQGLRVGARMGPVYGFASRRPVRLEELLRAGSIGKE